MLAQDGLPAGAFALMTYRAESVGRPVAGSLLIAPDSFKGTFGARAAAQALARVLEASTLEEIAVAGRRLARTVFGDKGRSPAPSGGLHCGGVR